MIDELLLATRNRGKIEEMIALLSNTSIQIRTIDEFPDAPEVEEDADTLERNARKKAETLAERTGLPALADDTGLEVRVLGGEPGVRSARYAGPECDAARNRQLLLSRMRDAVDRTARFRTVIALAPVNGESLIFEGICGGVITQEERGSGGFGYDKIFQPAGSSLTFAEMTPESKNAISHRGRAVRLAADFLSRQTKAGER